MCVCVQVYTRVCMYPKHGASVSSRFYIGIVHLFVIKASQLCS